jgi:hypothetical protein
LDRQLNEDDTYMKFALLVTYTLAACVHPEDPRDNGDSAEDETLAYITETIFVPYCASAECHSSLKQAGIPGGDPIVLDTVEHAQQTLQRENMLECTARGMLFDPCDTNADPSGSDAGTTELAELIGSGGYEIDSETHTYLQMPYDQPLASKDVAFIVQWIVDGAAGYTPNAGTQQ